MNASKAVCKFFPSCIVAVLLVAACVVFNSKYAAVVGLPLLFDSDIRVNRMLFYANFFAPLAVCAASLYVCIFSSGFYSRGICIVVGFVSAVLSVYVLDDLFMLKIFIYGAYLATVSVSFTSPKSIILTVGGTALFLFASLHPAFLGVTPADNSLVIPNSAEITSMATILLLPSVSLILLRFFTDRYVHSEEAVKYLDSMGKKLVVFNHRLQELANTRGEEAVKQDRLRFTRDLHDGCGYAFTNIIAVTDAAVSRGQMETTQSQEIFQSIRNLATEGLRETRDILHLIREITEPYSSGTETILQLKNIFEEVTGIQVAIEWGNIRPDYGPEINTVLARIVQEAFTNASRHGQATRIQIHFLEFSQALSMVVSDNGVGTAVIVKGIGLAGMEERLAVMGGSLEVSQPPEGGFQLAIRIPLIA